VKLYRVLPLPGTLSRVCHPKSNQSGIVEGFKVYDFTQSRLISVKSFGGLAEVTALFFAGVVAEHWFMLVRAPEGVV